MAFKEIFVSYGKYHNNIINKLIHIVFIPTIVFCVYGIGHFYPIANIDFMGIKELDIGLVMLVLLPPVYIFSGLLTTLCLIFMYFCSLSMFEQHKFDKDFYQSLSYFQFLLALKTFSWIMQFLGHGIFEGRAPALMNNAFSALVAPTFVVIEILYMFGYNKEKINECQVIIDKDIAEYRETKKANTS